MIELPCPTCGRVVLAFATEIYEELISFVTKGEAIPCECGAALSLCHMPFRTDRRWFLAPVAKALAPEEIQ